MIRGTVTYIAPPDVLARELKSGLKEGLQAMIEHWHSHMLPGHFERQAHAQYGYKNRSEKWIKRKLYKTGQAVDLVFTGRLKRDAIRSIRISGTANKAQGVLDLPKYAYQTRRYATRQAPNKAAEIIAITEAEMTQLAVELDRRLGETLNKTRETRTLTP